MVGWGGKIRGEGGGSSPTNNFSQFLEVPKQLNRKAFILQDITTYMTKEQITTCHRVPKKFGARGAHILVPSNWLGQEVKLNLVSSNPEYREITWQSLEDWANIKLKGTDIKSIKKLIEDEIEEAKKVY